MGERKSLVFVVCFKLLAFHIFTSRDMNIAMRIFRSCQPPLNQRFYRFMANMMSLSTVGNRQMWGYETYPKIYVIINKVTFTFGPIIAVSQLFYMYFNYSDLTFDILGVIFSIFPATCLANVDVFSSKLKSYTRISHAFLSKIHIYNVYKHNKSEFIKNKLLFVERSSRFTSFYMIFFYIFNWLSWILITAVNNFTNKELVHNQTAKLQTCVFLWLPFDYSYDYRRWIVIHSINCYIVLAGECAIMIYQSINCMFIYNLIGHIEILKNKIKTEFKDDLSDKVAHSRLVEIIKYHTFICQVFGEVQEAFGINVTANYLQNLVGNSIVLYQLKYGGKENILQYLTMVMAYTGGPIMMSLVIDELRKKTYDLSNLIYEIPWENMSVPNQKIVMVILQKMQIIMDFKAFGGIRAGIAPMMSILKTTFSYYVILESSVTVG